jgi:transposase
VAQAASSLGVTTNLLYRWKLQQEPLSTGKGMVEEQRSELLRLPKEVKELRMEKDIIKKASAFFAKAMK